MRSRLNPRRIMVGWACAEDGVAGSEYAILLSLIIIGSMGVIGSIGEKFAVLYQIITDALPHGI
jgi:hypothetical protein